MPVVIVTSSLASDKFHLSQLLEMKCSLRWKRKSSYRVGSTVQHYG
jgi:hypothetical protein